MKNYIKITAVALAAVLMLALCACGGKEIQKNVKDGVLTMVTWAKFPPYEFYEDGKITGIDAEIAKAVAEKLGLELEIISVDFEAVADTVKSGKADVALAAWTVTDERKESVDFTTGYAVSVQAIIVVEGSGIKTVDDLSKGGCTIGVQQGTTGDLYTTWDLADNGLAAVSRYETGADAIHALITGDVDCVVIDNKPAKMLVGQNENLKLLDTAYTTEQYAIGYNKNNQELGKAVDDALKDLLADGTIQSIINKYIKV